MATRNGTPPTDRAARLVRGVYAEQAMQSLGDGRMIDRQFILRSIGEFNPEYVPIQRLRQMRRDAMIKMALHYVSAAVIKAEYDIQCEDPRVAAGMREIYEQVHTSWVKTALNMLPFGYQGCIKQYEYGEIHGTYEGKDGSPKKIWTSDNVKPIMLGTPIPLPPEDTRVHMKDGEYVGIDTPLVKNENAGQGSDQPSIPAEFTLWFTNDFEEEFRNYYGSPRILPAYRAWWSYWFTFHMRDRHAEMDADPALQVWYPTGTYPDPTDETFQDEGRPQKRLNNKDAALKIGNDLRSGATIVWPSDVYTDEAGRMTPTPLWRAEFLKGGENLASFNALLTDLKLEKLAACLVPTDALQQMPGGPSSKNVTGEAQDFFTQSLEQTAMYLDQAQNRYQLNELAKANFGEDCPRVTKVTTGFQADDLQLINQLLELAMTADPNALPIDWEEILKQAGVAMLSKQEQDNQAAEKLRQEQEAADTQAAAAGGAGGGQVGPLPGEGLPPVPGANGGPPGGGVPSAGALAAAQDGRRTERRPYEREHIYLTTRVPTAAPAWAKREARRRDRNVNALAERLGEVVESRYSDAFHLASEAIEDQSDYLHMGLADKVKGFLAGIWSRYRDRLANYDDAVTGELASLYHTAGVAELSRLGLSTESWDVGRDDVQEWARTQAGALIKTMDQTLVEQHLRPWLAQALSEAHWGDAPEGIPVDSMELAAQLTDKFGSYPRWMAERVVRTEAMRGYNLAAADTWERVGITEVEEFDGLGGKTGKTDAECLARNGRRVSIDEFRDDVMAEHPNGTLGAVPVTEGVALEDIQPGIILSQPLTSQSIYAVSDDGVVLSQEEVGRALAAA